MSEKKPIEEGVVRRQINNGREVAREGSPVKPNGPPPAPQPSQVPNKDN